MGIIAITRGYYSSGNEIAEKVAQKLGYGCISREIILEASKEFNIPELSLIHAFEDPPSILDRFTGGKKKYIGFTRSTLLKHLLKDNVVYHGFAGHFFVDGVSHLLKVLITANLEYRIPIVMERDNVSRKEASRFSKKIDDQRRKWGQKLYGIDSWDPSLYDLVLRIDKVMVWDAVDTICRIARLKQFQTSPESKREMEDLALTIKVKNFLMDLKPKVDVYIKRKLAYLVTDAQLSQESEVVNKMGEIMKMLPELKGIKVVKELRRKSRAPQ
jgi:cytidylate kinase